MPVPIALKKGSEWYENNRELSVEGEGGLPDGLVGNDNLSPLLLAQLLSGSVELAGDNLDSLVGITLLNNYQRNRV